MSHSHHTLETIAKLAGVSRSTVSRVINNEKSVRNEVRERVLSVIEEERFYPNASARSLASRKTNCIGVLSWGADPEFLSDPIYYEILLGIQKEALKHDLDLILFTSQTDGERRKELCYRILGQKNVDGLVIMGSDFFLDYLRLFTERNLPVVLIGKRKTEDLEIPYVCTDYKAGIYSATSFLMDLGRTEIVLLQASVDVHFQGDKLKGYKKALKERKLAVKEDYIINVESTDDECLENLVQTRIQGRPVNGMICANDLLAQRMIKVLTASGISVPGEISVIGFNDASTARDFIPPLTTVRQNKVELGINALSMLRKLINGDRVENIILPADLVVRASTAPL